MNDTAIEKSLETTITAPPVMPRAKLPYRINEVEAAASKYPEETGRAVVWLFKYGKRHDYSAQQLAGLMRKSSTLITKLFTGTYDVKDYGPITRDIIRLYDDIKLKENLQTARFVETSISRKIAHAIELARIYRKIVMIWGPSHCGKTWALHNVARRINAGEDAAVSDLSTGSDFERDIAIYVEMPTGGTARGFLDSLARACCRGAGGSWYAQKAAIWNRITPASLPIIDEFTKVFPDGKKARVKTVEQIREIHDAKKCGLVLCGTLIGKDAMQEDQQRKLLQQIINRSVEPVIVGMPTEEDLHAIAAKSFGLASPPTTRAQEIIDQLFNLRRKDGPIGLEAYTFRLEMAATWCAREKQQLTWDHFVQAHDAQAKLSDPDYTP